MIGLLLVLMGVLVLHHWLVEPFAQLVTPLLSLSWLGWGGVGLALWLFAGSQRLP